MKNMINFWNKKISGNCPSISIIFNPLACFIILVSRIFCVQHMCPHNANSQSTVQYNAYAQFHLLQSFSHMPDIEEVASHTSACKIPQFHVSDQQAPHLTC